METKTRPVEIDGAGMILGRLAAELAVRLRGKDKTSFMPNLPANQKVLVYNTDAIRLSGRKIETKVYRRHTGYPGGIVERALKDILARDSREVVRRAVYGMLAKNRLRDRLIKNLILYKGLPEEHGRK